MNIYKLKNYLYGLALFIVVTTIIGCSEEESVEEFPFADNTKRLLTEKFDDVNLFYQAAEKAGLEDLFTGDNEYTFFVPDNDAIQVALEANGFSSITDAEVSFLTSLVNDHTVDGMVKSSDLEKTGITTLSGKTIYVSVQDGVFLNADGEVSDADNETQNGVVHVIDFPLMDFPSATITEIVEASASATENQEFTVLLHALQYTGLDAALDGTDLLTVFAPTDAAFNAIGLDIDAINGLSPEVVTELLQFHVLSGRNFTLDISSGRYYTLAGDEESGTRGLDLSVENDGVEIEIAGTVASTSAINLLAINGTIHVIDEVIQAEPYLMEAISGAYNITGVGFDGVLLGAYYNGLLASTYDFDSLLSREEEFTLFVPRFFNNTVGEDTLTENLLGHIFPGAITVDGVSGSRIESINGREYYATEAADGYVYINGRSRLQTFTDGSTIVEDYEAYNGLISNFLGEFFPLPEMNAAELITDDTDAMDSLSLFNAVLEFLELDDLADVTYLYVNNEDFADAYDEAGIAADPAELANADAEVLEEIINNHIITNVFFSNELEDGAVLTDRNGTEIEVGTVTANGEDQFGILIIDEGIITAVSFSDVLDVLANNGVIHVLDDVLIN